MGCLYNRFKRNGAHALRGAATAPGLSGGCLHNRRKSGAGPHRGGAVRELEPVALRRAAPRIGSAAGRRIEGVAPVRLRHPATRSRRGPAAPFRAVLCVHKHTAHGLGAARVLRAVWPRRKPSGGCGRADGRPVARRSERRDGRAAPGGRPHILPRVGGAATGRRHSGRDGLADQRAGRGSARGQRPEASWATVGVSVPVHGGGVGAGVLSVAACWRRGAAGTGAGDRGRGTRGAGTRGAGPRRAGLATRSRGDATGAPRVGGDNAVGTRDAGVACRCSCGRTCCCGSLCVAVSTRRASAR